MNEAETAPETAPETFAALACLPDRLRLPLDFDADGLAADLAMFAAMVWTPHFVTQNYAGDWAILPLRCPRGTAGLHPILQATSHPDCEDWEDTVLLGACPAFAAVLAAMPGRVGAARLMRLSAGSVIREHRDADLAPEYGTVRLHIPIATNRDVDFRLNGVRVAMAVGETWYLRLADPHSVVNGGAGDRVHLVIDAGLDARLASLLMSSAAPS